MSTVGGQDQNYNRYSYAHNSPLKYTDPSGFCTEVLTASQCAGIIYSVYNIASSIFGGNGCDRTCQERKASHNWCKAQSWCFELIQESREKFRKRSALKIYEATQAGLEVTAVSRRGEITTQIPVVGAIVDRQSHLNGLLDKLKYLTTEKVSEINPLYSVIAGLKITYDPNYNGVAMCCSNGTITVGSGFFKDNSGIPTEATPDQIEYLSGLTPEEIELFQLAHEAAHGTEQNRQLQFESPPGLPRKGDPVELDATNQAINWAKTVF